MSEINGQYKLHLKHDSKVATAVAVISSLMGYGMAAYAVYSIIHSNIVLGASLILLGCLCIASGGALAEIIEQGHRSKKAAGCSDLSSKQTKEQ